MNVAITNVVDDKFGDLDDSGGNGCFDVPINLAPGEKVSCTVPAARSPARGRHDARQHRERRRDRRVRQRGLGLATTRGSTITPRLIDLVIVKEASSPTPLNGIVNYSLTVTNKGPDTATNVQLADPAPAGITYLTANPSQGTCTSARRSITCSLGTIDAGSDGDDRDHGAGDNGRDAHEHRDGDGRRRSRDQPGRQRRLRA